MNMCGKCGKKQMKFQTMEHPLLDLEKARMRMFFDKDFKDEEEDKYFLI